MSWKLEFLRDIFSKKEGHSNMMFRFRVFLYQNTSQRGVGIEKMVFLVEIRLESSSQNKSSAIYRVSQRTKNIQTNFGLCKSPFPSRGRAPRPVEFPSGRQDSYLGSTRFYLRQRSTKTGRHPTMLRRPVQIPSTLIRQCKPSNTPNLRKS